MPSILRPVRAASSSRLSSSAESARRSCRRSVLTFTLDKCASGSVGVRRSQDRQGRSDTWNMDKLVPRSLPVVRAWGEAVLFPDASHGRRRNAANTQLRSPPWIRRCPQPVSRAICTTRSRITGIQLDQCQYRRQRNQLDSATLAATSVFKSLSFHRLTASQKRPPRKARHSGHRNRRAMAARV